MAGAEKVRCNWCRKMRLPDDVTSSTSFGGGSYNRGGRNYTIGVCRFCCIDLADLTRLQRFANPFGVKDGKYNGAHGYHLGHQKKACEKFGIPVDDLPDSTFEDNKPQFSKPKHPLRFDRAAEFGINYNPRDIEIIKDHWRSLGATAVRKVAMEYYEWRDDQWVTTLDGATDVVMEILSRIPGARPNRAHVRADIDESHFADDPDFRFNEEQLIERLIVDANGSIPIDDAYDMVADELLAIFPLDY